MSRRQQKKAMIAGVASVLILLLCVYGFSLYYQTQQDSLRDRLQTEYDKKITELETRQQTAKTRILVANRELPSGTTLQASDVKTVEVSMDQLSADSLKEPDAVVGKITKIDLQPNAPIIASMLYVDKPIPRDLRLQEFHVIQLPTNLQKGQFIDIRINFPTGQDYIVLSKKKVKELEGTIVWVEMNEKEILMASSAIIDAYLQGAKLYALTYVDPGMQDPAIANYPSNPKVLDLMERDPNVLETAKTELARQLRNDLDNDLKAMNAVDKMKVNSGSVTVQQQIQNERVTTQQNNASRQALQQQVQQPVKEKSVIEQQNNQAQPIPSSPMSTPDPNMEPSESAPDQPATEEQPPKADKLDQVFEQPNVGGS